MGATGTGGGTSAIGSTQPAAGACAAPTTAAAPAAQMALADAGEPKALNATQGLTDGIVVVVAETGIEGTVVAALAAVELTHNAHPRSAPTICLGSLAVSIERDLPDRRRGRPGSR
jgi:hypothetical protein